MKKGKKEITEEEFIEAVGDDDLVIEEVESEVE